MASGSLAELIAGFKAAIRRALNVVRAFAGTVRPEAPVKLPAAPAAHFGEQERLEESKYYPPAPSDNLKLEGELPESYGKTRVVLLVVDPNLVHAYLELVRCDLPIGVDEVRVHHQQDDSRLTVGLGKLALQLQIVRRRRRIIL